MRLYRTLKRVCSPLEAPAHYTVSIRWSTSLKRAEPRLRQTEDSCAESIRGGPLSEDRLLKGGAKDRFVNDNASPT
jgi:hypothetical protein